ncbi:MAG: 4-alpha-glucanotransferase [Desulfomonile tiedjei]|uniref:4-alpha-glucanotransferase n=1 Tax=Desulfomonile tiedjei TaxID=2358 RepID=A0A9D6V1V3_9BACT|nr:4-alpha-glucanotransferase [Desulfomonile tiedjei]
MIARGSGILIHLTSLPSRFGIGDMGPWAYRFVDFLVQAKQNFWQVLPLNVTTPDHYSPYTSPSAFACNTLLISPELLMEDGLLAESDLGRPEFPTDFVDYPTVQPYKEELLRKAFSVFRTKRDCNYDRFVAENRTWLEDFALFRAFKHRFDQRVWSDWPYEIRDRHPEALASAAQELRDQMELERFGQFIFRKQWSKLAEYCRSKGVQILGDIPIYVDYDSADVWCNPQYFKLDERKKPYVVAGVPPDYFSETGQLWGVPIYRWDILEQDGFGWWIRRLEHNLEFCDFLRIDHFRGLAGYWEVPANEQTAINGKWIEGPSKRFFKALLKRFPRIPIIAEDLGIITPDVRELMRDFEIPGMKVLLFSFGDDQPTNPYTVHNFEKNCIAYTGTHDTNTIRGWFDAEASWEQKNRLREYLGREVPVEELHWELVRLLMMSVANMVMFPMQDILGLGNETRMNYPSRSKGNWKWRLRPEQLEEHISNKLASMTTMYGRA